jgi:DNA-binding NarL/FixJ family response regulator
MRALDLGAMGFIPKSQPSRVMIGALKLVLSGGVYLPAEVLAQPEKPARAAEDEADYAPRSTAADIGLTPRQTEVLSLLVQGKPNKIICRELNLAEGTVKIHVAAILKALGVSNRTQAVVEVGRRRIKLAPLERKAQSAAAR